MSTVALPQDLQASAVAGKITSRAQRTSRGLGAELLANRTLAEMFTAFHRKTRASWDFTHGVVRHAPHTVTPSVIRHFVTVAAQPNTQLTLALPAQYRAEIDDAQTTLTVHDEFGTTHTRPIRNGLTRTLRVEGLSQTSQITAGRFLVRIACD